MRKFQMVQTFQKLEAIERSVEFDNTTHRKDTAILVADLREHLEEVRSGWWSDSTKVFVSLCKTLDAFYCESWGPEFKATEKKRKARNRYANILLDNFRQSWREPDE